LALDGSEWSVSLPSHLNPGVIAPCNRLVGRLVSSTA